MTASLSVSTPTIAVAGSSGPIGARVAALLADRGVAQRLPAPVARRAPRPARADVVEVGSYRDIRAMRRALTGIDTFLLAPGRQSADPIATQQALLEAAIAAGVRRVVQLSLATGAEDDPRDTQVQLERAVIESGMEWTIARISVAFDLIPTAVGRDGRILRPGAGWLAPVAHDDVAEGLVALLTDDVHAGCRYTFTGPEALTLDEIAEIMSSHAPEAVTAVDPGGEELPVAPAAAVWWRDQQGAFRAGALAAPTRDLALLLGRSPMDLDAWLRAHPFALVHVGFHV